MGQEMMEFIKTRRKVNLFIVILNVLIFLVSEILGSTVDTVFMLGHGAMYVPVMTEYGEYYRLFTCMFLHFGIEHLAYNMLLLLFAGDRLEEEVGPIRYLLIYLGGGVAGNLLSWAWESWRGSFAVSAGASGAIFAVVGALVVIVLKNRGRGQGINPRRLGLMVVLSLVNGFTEAGTDNAAHVGGLLGGMLLCFLMYRSSAEE